MNRIFNCISYSKVCGIKNYALVIAVLFSTDIFSQAPTITSFTPTSAAKGTTVTITGTNYTGASAVSFGGVAASSFVVISPTQITAVVPVAVSGLVSVTNAGLTGTRAGFYYLSLAGIITDFEGYWSTTTASNNPVLPDNSHNLLAFTYNGVTYSTGVNNNILTGQGINFTAGNFKSLPVANISGTNSAASIYLAMATKADGSETVANASVLEGATIRDVMTDGTNGLNLGTGVTNLPTSAIMTFDVHLIYEAKISDEEPDIIITQIADPTSGNDIFQFVDASGVIVGNTVTQNMTILTKLGAYKLDLFNLSPGAPFNSAMCYSAFSTNGTRDMRMVGFKLSDFGITPANFPQVASLKITPSGTSDYAFIAYSDAIEMSPNISQNIEKTNSSICTGGTANMEIVTSAAYGGSLSYLWEESTDGGTSWSIVSNGGSYSGAITKRLTITSATDSYKYRATVTESGTGYSATCSPFTIAVIAPAAPTGVSISSTTTTCLNNLVSLSSTVTGGSNLFYQWETNASGSYVSIPDAILKTYLPPVNIPVVISYRLKVSSGSGCSGTLTSSPVVITVVGISSTTPAARCGTGLVSLGAIASSGTINWYAASTGGSSLATGGTYSPSISATTTYYVTTTAASCSTGVRIPVVATINSIIWAGTNTTDWSTLANWDCGGTPPSLLPTSTNDVTIPTSPTGGRFPNISVTAPINNITISTGASIVVASGGVFEIYGAISNNGTFTATSGTISMRGSVQQTIPANAFSTNTIKNLIINNAAGVLLGGELNLTDTYTPTAGVLTTFGYLTLKSNASGTARVAPGTVPYITGNVNLERYVPERRSWRLMTTPLTNSNTIYQSWQNGGVYALGKGLLVTAPVGGAGIDAVGNSSLKTWNVATQTLQHVTNTTVPISATNTGSADNTGYFIFVRGDRDPGNIDPHIIRKNITTLTSTGYLQTGTQNFTGLSAVANAFSLVGNPYASPINWNLVLANPGTTNIKRKFYVWDPRLNTAGGYAVMDDLITPGVFLPTPGSSTQDNFIQSAQALYIITNASGAATVQVTETNKASTNNTSIFGRPEGSSQSLVTNLLLLNPTDSSTIEADGTRVDFNISFSDGVDDDDNIKFPNVNETFGLTRNTAFLATERRPAITLNDTLFFKLTKATERSYQFHFKPSGFSDPALLAMLEDSYANTTTVLSLTGITRVNFVINSDAGSKVSNRFRVVFTQTATLPVSFTSIRASRKSNQVAVEWKVERELNIKHYDTERSPDGINFTKVNTTAAKGYNQSTGYGWIDTRPEPGNNFYRIKSIGLDGATWYSEVVKVNEIDGGEGMQVYPNPIENRIMNLRFIDKSKGMYSVMLSNNMGQAIVLKELKHAGGSSTHSIMLPSSVKTGTYQAEVQGEGTTVTMKIFVK